MGSPRSAALSYPSGAGFAENPHLVGSFESCGEPQAGRDRPISSRTLPAILA